MSTKEPIDIEAHDSWIVDLKAMRRPNVVPDLNFVIITMYWEEYLACLRYSRSSSKYEKPGQLVGVVDLAEFLRDMCEVIFVQHTIYNRELVCDLQLTCSGCGAEMRVGSCRICRRVVEWDATGVDFLKDIKIGDKTPIGKPIYRTN